MSTQIKTEKGSQSLAMSCGICGRSFNSWQACHQHMDATGHGYECETCVHEFYTYDSACDHMYEYDHWRKQFECEGCSSSFDTRAEAKRHMQQEDHWRTYRCQSCDRGFENENNLRQHLNSNTHRGTDITCPFCKRSFATATGVAHHLEAGSCRNARSLNRDTILTEIWRRDPSHLITKKLLTYHSEPSLTATSASWNPYIGKYECYLCHKAFSELHSLNSHVNSPAHKDNVYHCPGQTCRKEFRALAALFNHLESETCGAVRFDAVQRNVGGILSGQRRICLV
ncbi:hypothetical protein C7974DRAFT_430449 [Boeremia exigua]|uniref:uncharacterized protein n=1 Tax=Boeremia exigua TaxID=749465 RepID=UPI001E8D6171|nr:uncharacterized protein C7974DRAFT_430449 [Boeremia exigua]KAH6644751.1 hypothetical protein C7974DRAFT_430449 [Boeremia exigua]